MGSIEVYDTKQEKWVPYMPDYDEWYQHFKDLRDGYVQPDHMGRYVEGSGKKYRKLKEMEARGKEIEMREQQRPILKQITPVGQAIEIAKSEIERDSKKEGGSKRKKAKSPNSLSKRLRRYAYNPENQVLTMMNQDNCNREELLLFSLPPSDTALQSREWIEYRPVNQITGSTVLDFNIPSQSSAYIDLKNSRLNVKLRLTNNDGTPLKDGEVVGLVNLPLQTIFRQVDVTFQQTQVSHTGTNYPYKAYIDTILKTNLSTKENLLTSQLFYKDKGPDTNDAKTGSNGGLFERAVATIGGKIVYLEGPLFLDLFEQSRLLVNGVSIGIKLWPS